MESQIPILPIGHVSVFLSTFCELGLPLPRPFPTPQVDGKQHGSGFYTSSKRGTTHEGVWEDGKRQRWVDPSPATQRPCFDSAESGSGKKAGGYVRNFDAEMVCLN